MTKGKIVPAEKPIVQAEKAADDLDVLEELSIQDRKRFSGAGLNVLMWAVSGAGIISPWWSKRRDSELRKFWKGIDHLASAIYTLQAKLITIPVKVVPKDFTIKTHVEQAEAFTIVLNEKSEFYKGWPIFYAKFLEDLIGQDNGAFSEVIGEGEPDGPIVGMPYGLSNLDSWYCTRTGDPEFPVIYDDPGGKRFKLHHSRVIYTSQMPSANVLMNDVGFCAISRCLNIAQSLLDLLIYKQEKLGSRPHRGILVTKGGLDPDDVNAAFRLAEARMDAQMLTRFSKLVVVGSEDLEDAGIEKVDIASLPDGFDERETTVLAMAAIALAFGMDARELFPAMSAGATRAEALVQHMKQRSKGPGQILQDTEQLLNYKFLPPHLEVMFDFQDDAQDRQVAEIKNIRAERHERAILSGYVDERTIREQMLLDGDLTEEQFMRLELEEGRLEDGSNVLTLFVNKEYDQYLNLGIEDPLNVEVNDKDEVILAITEKRIELWKEYVQSIPRRRKPIQESLAALDKLEEKYKGAEEEEPEMSLPVEGEGEEEEGALVTVGDEEEITGEELELSEVQEVKLLNALDEWEQKAIARIREGKKPSYSLMGRGIPKSVRKPVSDRLKKAVSVPEVHQLFEIVRGNIKAVRIIPTGASERAPDWAGDDDVTEADFRRILRQWDTWLEDYAEILNARVVE